MDQYLKLVAHLLFMKNFYHNAHHVVSRAVFFADHAALADFYEALDDEYDSVAERFCAKFGCEQLSLPVLMALVAEKSKTVAHPKENKDVFMRGLQIEGELCAQAEAMIKGMPLTEGDKQLLGNLCVSSEGRQYKIKQRIK